MEAKKKKWIGIAAGMIMVCICAGVAISTVFADTDSAGQYDSAKTGPSGITMGYYTAEGTTHIDVTMPMGSDVIGGREVWEAGEQITFQVSSESKFPIQVGIFPGEDMSQGWSYDSYGGFISGGRVLPGEGVTEIVATVPETGEYGVGIRSELSQEEINYCRANGISLFQVALDVDREFQNPLDVE